MLRRLYSWFKGHRIGESAYAKGSPFITGSPWLLLPTELWPDHARKSLRYRLDRYEWTGYSWKYIETISVSETSLKELCDAIPHLLAHPR